MSQLNPTRGEQRVGWFFIASGNDVADGIKTQCAALIDLISNYEEPDMELAHKAQDLIEEACKMAVELLNKKKSV
jgi:hypothetical protein